MKVTVLMPVYNAEKYLHDSIGSLLSQTSNQWKLICIDDGSTDNSKHIIEEYCKSDNRIKLISQKNAGPAMARAKAIEMVDTEYVSILDTDDAYSSNYIELMLKRAEETDADSIVPNVEFGYKGITKQQDLFQQRGLSPDLIIRNGIQAFSMTFPWRLHGWQMIKTELAKKYYTVVNAAYSKFNSDEFITRLLYLKSKMTVLCKAKYLYRIDANSLTRTASLKKLDYLMTLDKLLHLCYKENIPAKIIIEVYNNYYSTLISSLKMIKSLKQKEYLIALKRIKQSYEYSYKPNLKYRIVKQAKIRTQIKLMLSYSSFYFFRIMAL